MEESRETHNIIVPSRTTHSLDLADLTTVTALCCSSRVLLHASRSGGSGRGRLRLWHPRRPGIDTELCVYSVEECWKLPVYVEQFRD
jgi:hypothetical protein